MNRCSGIYATPSFSLSGSAIAPGWWRYWHGRSLHFASWADTVAGCLAGCGGYHSVGDAPSDL